MLYMIRIGIVIIAINLAPKYYSRPLEWRQNAYNQIYPVTTLWVAGSILKAKVTCAGLLLSPDLSRVTWVALSVNGDTFTFVTLVIVISVHMCYIVVYYYMLYCLSYLSSINIWKLT